MRFTCCAIGVGIVLVATPAVADINIEFRPSLTTVNLNDPVDIGVFLVSDDATNQSFAAADIFIGWDNAALTLLGLSNTGAVPLLRSAFPVVEPYNVNEAQPPQDGDAYYQALAFLGSPVNATPAGTRITTLQFIANSLSPSTFVEVLATAGNPSGQTRVFDGTVPNLDVTGSFTPAKVQIVPEPASILMLIVAGVGIRRR